MNEEKKEFLKFKFIPLLQRLHAPDKGSWGVMNAQQMVEHFADAVKNASGSLVLPVLNEGDTLAKYREFLMTETPFRENTKNPLMSEEPAALRQPDMESAINKLQAELDNFFNVYDANSSLTNNNPFFGELNYEQQVQLLYKHAQHHLEQFGLI